MVPTLGRHHHPRGTPRWMQSRGMDSRFQHGSLATGTLRCWSGEWWHCRHPGVQMSLSPPPPQGQNTGKGTLASSVIQMFVKFRGKLITSSAGLGGSHP